MTEETMKNVQSSMTDLCGSMCKDVFDKRDEIYAAARDELPTSDKVAELLKLLDEKEQIMKLADLARLT